MLNKPAQKEEEEKTIACPLAPKVILSVCPNTMCMWHNKKANGNCGYNEKGDENDQAIKLGLSLEEASLEIRRAKTAIQKIMVLDKYIEFVREKTRGKKERIAPLLESDVFLVSLVDKGHAWNSLFHMNVPLFVELCRKKNYKEFIRAHRTVTSYKLASLLGVRESILSKVNARYNSLVRKKKPIAVVIEKQSKR